MKLTPNDIKEMRELAVLLDLDGKERLLETPDEIIAEVCNGIGPEWFPPALRNAIDKLHPSLVIVSVIHDLDFYFGDGTTMDFMEANARFRRNGKKVANYRYQWYDIRRYLARHSARRFAAICDFAGRPAYNLAILDRGKREREERRRRRAEELAKAKA